jgi:hypothetical protein
MKRTSMEQRIKEAIDMIITDISVCEGEADLTGAEEAENERFVQGIVDNLERLENRAMNHAA